MTLTKRSPSKTLNARIIAISTTPIPPTATKFIAIMIIQ